MTQDHLHKFCKASIIVRLQSKNAKGVVIGLVTFLCLEIEKYNGGDAFLDYHKQLRKECNWVLDFVYQYHKGYDRLLKIDINYAIKIKQTFDLDPYSILYSLIKEGIINHFRRTEVLRVNDNGTCTVELTHDGDVVIKLFGHEVNLTKE